jgi:hypothetical protein
MEQHHRWLSWRRRKPALGVSAALRRRAGAGRLGTASTGAAAGRLLTGGLSLSGRWLSGGRLRRKHAKRDDDAGGAKHRMKSCSCHKTSFIRSGTRER